MIDTNKHLGLCKHVFGHWTIPELQAVILAELELLRFGGESLVFTLTVHDSLGSPSPFLETIATANQFQRSL